MVLQSAISDDEPSQSLPPSDGEGFVHVLVLDFVPVPHVFEHSVYSPHSVHCPFTGNKFVRV